MLLLKSKYLLLAGVAAISLSLAGCGDDAKNNNSAPPSANINIDKDGDGLTDKIDLCLDVQNAGPGENDDPDGDGLGNLCDPNDDRDTLPDSEDNCPLVSNQSQSNDVNSATPAGDACEDDFDGDGVKNNVDSCPNVANLKGSNGTEVDSDADGINDACDDSDSDGVIDRVDNCVADQNPDQRNTDGDMTGDICESKGDKDTDNDTVLDGSDNCPLVKNTSQNPDACLMDRDGDLVPNETDNCPTTANRDQKNSTNDNIGDACQDSDGDGVLDSRDNCLVDVNPLQENNDKADEASQNLPLRGDACDEDDDNDGVLDNAPDACPFFKNSANDPKDCDQNRDDDAFEDNVDLCPDFKSVTNEAKFCASDSDGDGVTDPSDNCPTIVNKEQINSDTDELGDACDPNDDNDAFDDKDSNGDSLDKCPLVASPTNESRFCSTDFDADTVLNDDDNCPTVPNSSQTDLDSDKQGDACDSDTDGDGVPNEATGAHAADNCPLIANPDQQINPCNAADIGNLSCQTYQSGTVTPIIEGALCGAVLNALGQPLGLCAVNDPAAAADANSNTFATINNSVVLPDSLAANALTGEVGARVTLAAESPAGSIAAMEIDIPGGTLDLALFRNLVFKTFLNGVEQESRATLDSAGLSPDALSIDLLGQSPIGSSPRALIGFISTKPFNAVQLTVTAGLSVDLLEQVKIYDTCKLAGVNSTGGGGGGTPGGIDNPLADITTQLGTALAPVTGVLGAVTGPLSGALDSALSDTPLAFVSDALVPLLNGGGSGGNPPPGETPAIPTSLDDLIALFPENPLTGPLTDALETLMGFIPGGETQPPAGEPERSPLFPLTGPLGAALDPLTAALDPLANPLTEALTGALGATPLSPVSLAVNELLNGGDPDANPLTALPAPLNNLGNPQEALTSLTNLLSPPDGASPIVDIGNALAVVTQPLSIVIDPLTSQLTDAIGETPLSPVGQVVDQLLNGEAGEGGPGSFPLDPAAFQELLTNNPLTGLLAGGAEGFPTTPEAVQELLTNNPLTGLLAGGAESFPTTPEAFQELLTNNPLTQALTGAAANFPFNPFG